MDCSAPCAFDMYPEGEWDKQKSQVILNTKAPLLPRWSSKVHSVSPEHQTGTDKKKTLTKMSPHQHNAAPGADSKVHSSQSKSILGNILWCTETDVLHLQQG